MHKILLIVLFCQLNSLHDAYGNSMTIHQPDLPSFGDFMEYYLSVPLSCANVTDVRNVTNLITKTFAECTTKLSASMELFGNLRLACESQEQYLQCWDQLKEDIITHCHRNSSLPAVYPATVKSLCGNDKGNTTIANLKKSIHTMTVEDRDNCPEETGIHWLDNCKSMLETMISDNLCERHTALDKCLGKITCLNFDFGRLQKEMYSGGRVYLNCDSLH